MKLSSAVGRYFLPDKNHKDPSEQVEAMQPHFKDTICRVDSERKHLEGLLKDRINFYLVCSSVFLAGLYRIDEPMRLVVLIAATLVSIILGLAVWRTHRLVEKALKDIKHIDPTHPYIRYRKGILFPPDANKILIAVPAIITVLFIVLTCYSFVHQCTPMKLLRE